MPSRRPFASDAGSILGSRDQPVPTARREKIRIRVASVIAPREIRLKEARVPTPGPDEALVRIKAVVTR
jgi:hypothetical protein